MIKLIPLFCILLFIGCKTTKTSLISETKKIKTTNCPDNGICTVEFIPNSSLVTKKDEFGSLYADIDSGENIVYKYTFARNKPKNTEDSQFIEEIYAEFDNKLSNIELKNGELSKVKLLLNRICFCKGTAGFYEIKKGRLLVVKNGEKSYNIQIEFNVEGIPQIISKINETYILE